MTVLTVVMSVVMIKLKLGNTLSSGRYISRWDYRLFLYLARVWKRDSMLFQYSMELSILFHDCDFLPYCGRISLSETLHFLFQIADIALLTVTVGPTVDGM